ncbi:hypothetical protein ACJMK2_039714 [Sinanodonta woodiana]|uniref:Uncharacterized protein n=1 Tax=Sinanodonta woodiana TaxID=1069815 RepID=A0ABD3WCU9_SINWO
MEGRSIISDFFNTCVEGEPSHQQLVVYHREGCQTLNVGEIIERLPRQTEVFTTMQVAGIDIDCIKVLQYGGRNKYILHLKKCKQLFQASELHTDLGTKG